MQKMALVLVKGEMHVLAIRFFFFLFSVEVTLKKNTKTSI